MVGNRGSTAFTDQCRVRDFFLSANFGDGADNIPGVFGQGVVHRAFRVATGSVVIDRQSASDVQVSGFETDMVELSIKAGGFADGSAKGQNIGNLGSDVEVKHLQGFGAALFFEVFDRFEEFASGETKFSVIAAGKGPFADSTGGETDADAYEELDLHRTGGFDSKAELFGLFDHQNHFFTEFSSE